MNTNNTHSKYKSQLSIQLLSSSIEDFETTTRYLFQGRKIDRPRIEENLGDTLRPVWVDCVDIQIEDHGYVEHLTI